MAFKADSQTINDLKIIGDIKGNDIYNLFNKTRTKGATSLLKDMFLYPLSRNEDINNRVSSIKLLRDKDIPFKFSTDLFEVIEFYLENSDERSRLTVHDDSIRRRLNSVIGSDSDYKQIKRGVTSILRFFIELKVFNSQFEDSYKELSQLQEILNISALQFVRTLTESNIKNLTYKQVAEYDQLFRFSIKNELRKLLFFAYKTEVFISVAQVSKEYNFCFAQIVEGASNEIEMIGVYHPLISCAVPNDLTVNEENNMIFLTGANMAGKSTFMKTFCIAIYLAHMGFPVPAKMMNFSVQNGMFTTINLSDNLNLGFSHFYSEVLRVKKVAESLRANEKMIIVFDELFRGTNVKDAFDATVAVMNAFAGKRKSTFVISTHIIEAGEELKKIRENIKFLYLPTVMNGPLPEYTYKLCEGITNDRHGMVIIRNENILNILNAG